MSEISTVNGLPRNERNFSPNSTESVVGKEAKSIKGVYARMLGLEEFPSDPNQMPDVFHMPHEALGDIGVAIAQTTDNRERSQTQFFKNGVLKSSKIFIGTDSHTSRYEEIRFYLITRFGKTHFSRYHTHSNVPQWSNKDIALNIAYPTECLVDMLGSSSQIIALLRTSKSFHYQLPLIHGDAVYYLAKRNLSKIGKEASAPLGVFLKDLKSKGITNEQFQKQYVEQAREIDGQCSYSESFKRLKYLEQKGYAVYAAKINSDLVSANFPNGIDFKKATPQSLKDSGINI